jgi:hypothetical protein
MGGGGQKHSGTGGGGVGQWGMLKDGSEDGRETGPQCEGRRMRREATPG